ncbi:MAG TPA: hypothetical protein VLA89_01935, partial [Gemmatimonadales bacterium]|nr:hypothetical protein [Gemmatimonadales bacterium]
ESLRARLHESLVPVRLLLGTAHHPSGIKPEEVELLRTELPDFAIDSIQGSGQYVHEEQPDAVIATVERMSAPPPLGLEPPLNAVAAP